MLYEVITLINISDSFHRLQQSGGFYYQLREGGAAVRPPAPLVAVAPSLPATPAAPPPRPAGPPVLPPPRLPQPAPAPPPPAEPDLQELRNNFV